MVQVYLGFPPAAGEPPKVLRGFGKTLLESRQTMIVTATLKQRDLRYRYSARAAGRNESNHAGSQCL